MEILLEIAQIPRSTYYYHVKRQAVPDKYRRVKEEIASINHENRGRYGYRRITTELHNRGICINHKTVQHLMKEIGLVRRVRMKMLDRIFVKIPDGTNLILHSGQGWQYQRMLKAKGICQSMSRKGNCLDNAVIENFFGLRKSELLYLQTFESMKHFKAELIDCLDYCNNHRSKVKGLPPAIHRQQALEAA